MAELRPGLVVVNISAYGQHGPWAERAGFDMNGSAASGIMAVEAKDGRPLLPPTGMVNDFITGYFAAAGATAALLKRAREGGGSLVSVSLTRTAMEILSLGQIDGPLQEPGLKPETMTVETPLGVLHRLAPPVRFSRTPGRWVDPVLVYKGSSRPEWLPVEPSRPTG
jgi:crotonobetainyl-CoA:carnitine CoA-transferase CaiB-like acyl-CoA transferase